MNGMNIVAEWMPHGSCWLWDWRLILVHSISDLFTFIAYITIPAITAYIYGHGRLKSLALSFPRLWQLGAGFILFCGVSHLGSFLEVWFGGWLYIVTGINKVVMASISLWFAVEFWRRRNEISIIGRVIQMAGDYNQIDQLPQVEQRHNGSGADGDLK